MDDLIAGRLDTILLLQAMYPLPTELDLSETTKSFIVNPTDLGAPLEMSLRVSLEDDQQHVLELYILLAAIPDQDHGPGSRAKVMPRQPDWLNRSRFQNLVSVIEQCEDDTSSSEYILSSIDTLKEKATDLLRQQEPASDNLNRTTSVPAVVEKLERVWFWFPSLLSKEKRRDLVDYAPRFGLAGFILSGKPGLLCLEGDGRQVDKYMSSIKSESWSDIPSHQKKVTERLRKPLSSPIDRKFSIMSDITHLVPQYGQYNCRGEMSEVRRLMQNWGVGDDFGAAVMNAK